jgi:PAS domain S-box-containing protein
MAIALKTRRPVRGVEAVAERPDGTRVPFVPYPTPLFDSSGALIGAVNMLLDISDRKQSEHAAQHLAAIVESSDDAIVGKDLSGTIVSWNAGAERMFGYRADEAVGRPILLLVPDDRQEEEPRILETLRRGERIEHFETERVRKDGERIPVSISVSPIRDSAGNVVGAAKIARDVRVRRTMEAEREDLLMRERAARAEAEAASSSKDTFLATVSHELRAPLSPILSWARLLLEGRLDAEKTRHALAAIERNARSQSQLIDDLLDYSRVTAGKMRLEVRPVDLVPVTQAAVEVVRLAAEAKNIQLQVTLDAKAGRISGDPDRLQQVVWNLLSNAVKFTPKGGRVRVVLERVDSSVELAVNDTGQGIPAEFLPHIFERFQQADASTSRRHGGLGLGLAIVRYIVELHGGTVDAESSEAGATFTVRLPLMSSERRTAEGDLLHPASPALLENHAYPSLHGVRVFVVDDDADANEVLRTILSGCGAEVRAARSAAQALEGLTAWKPDLVVSDIAMPDEDGYALVEKIRAREEQIGRLPVIALTAYATKEDRVRLLAAGFQIHVPKPIDPTEVVAAVANVARTVGRL